MFLATDASSGSGVHEGREYEELRESGKHDDRGDQVVVDDMLPLLQAQVCKGTASQEIIYDKMVFLLLQGQVCKETVSQETIDKR